LGSADWTTVPDIWRTAAETYGDRTALVDPYHEPPLELTYKQVSLMHLIFIFWLSHLFPLMVVVAILLLLLLLWIFLELNHICIYARM